MGIQVNEEAVSVGVLVGVDTTAVDVGVRVGVAVAVLVGVFVDEGPTVLVGVGVSVEDVGPTVTTNWGGVVPSREENVIPSALSATRANVYVPFPFTKVVTSYSTHVSVPIAPLLSKAPLNKAGWVFQVMPPEPDSIQLLSARYTTG